MSSERRGEWAYDGHNRKPGHAKALRSLGHRKARRVWRALMRMTQEHRRAVA